jgi:hypothetical protein
MCHLRQIHSPTPLSTFLRGRTPLRLWSQYRQEKTRKKFNSYRRMMTMTIRRKKTMRRKKKKTETRLKVKKMKTTLLEATLKRMRRSTVPMRSRLLEMKPRSPLVD